MKLLIEREQVDAALAACNVQIDGEPYVDWHAFVLAMNVGPEPNRVAWQLDDGRDDVPREAISAFQRAITAEVAAEMPKLAADLARPTRFEQDNDEDDEPSEEAIREMEERLARREGIEVVSVGDPDLSHEGRSFASDRFVDG